MGGDGLVDIVWTAWGGIGMRGRRCAWRGGHRGGAGGVIGVRGRVGLLAGMRCLCALWCRRGRGRHGMCGVVRLGRGRLGHSGLSGGGRDGGRRGGRRRSRG